MKRTKFTHLQRTKFPRKQEEQPPIQMDLIRSLAWKFYKSSQVNWDELFSEACLAYCTYASKWDPTKGMKLTSYVYLAIKHELINFCKKEHRNRNPEGIERWCNSTSQEPEYEFFYEEIDHSEDVLFILDLLKSDPVKFSKRPTKPSGQLWQELLERGWSNLRIMHGIKQLKCDFAHLVE